MGKEILKFANIEIEKTKLTVIRILFSWKMQILKKY